MSKIYFPLPRKQTASAMLATFIERHSEETCFKQFVSCNAIQTSAENNQFLLCAALSKLNSLLDIFFKIYFYIFLRKAINK